MHSLVVRLLILVVAALLPLLGFEAYAEYSARQLRQQLMEDEALRLMRLVSNEQARIVEGAQQLLIGIVSTGAVQRGDWRRCQGIAQRLLAAEPRYDNMGIMGPDGALLCASDGMDLPRNGSDRTYFRLAMQSGGFVIGDYVLSRMHHRPVIHLATAFTGADARIAGVAWVSLKLDWLGAQLVRLPLPPGASASIADRNGIMLARYPEVPGAVGGPLTSGRRFILNQPDIGVATLPTSDGLTRLVAYSPAVVPPVGLAVAVGLDPATTYASVTHATRWAYVALLCCCALAVSLATLIAARLIRQPVAGLLDTAGKWQAGDLSARTGLRHGGGEFGRLAAAFDRMAEALHERDAVLQDSRLRLAMALDAAGLGILDVDLRTGGALLSPEAMRVLGCDPLTARRANTLFAAVHPDDQPDLSAAWARGDANPGLDVEAEYRLRQPDGTWRWIGIRGRCFAGPQGPERRLSVVQNITARKQAELALQANETRLRLSQEAGGIGIWDWDMASGRLIWSDLQCRQFGVDPALRETVSFETWRRVVHPDDADRVRELVQSAIKNGCCFETDYRINAPDGLRWMNGRGQVIRDAAGRAVRLVGIDRDVTERHRLIDELQDLTLTLEARVYQEVAAREAMQKRAAHGARLQALGQLASGIAHDFNNVLQMIFGAMDSILYQPTDPAGVVELAHLALEAAERGASVTGRLLAFGRRGDLHLEPVDTVRLLHDVREILVRTLGANIAVDIDAADDLGPVRADKSQLETTLINLATNSRDAMPLGGRLTMTLRTEVIATDDAGQPHGLEPGRYLRLAIADNGIGMDAATLARAGEPFFTTKTVGRGTGLGLSMAHGFAEQSGGAMSIESKAGIGTTVTLWLPQQDAGSEAGSSAGTPVGRMDLATASRVLLVDDEDGLRRVIGLRLARAGFGVLPAASAAEALSLLAGGEHVDALVTDLSMPGMDGVTLIRTVHAQHGDVPAVLLTGYAGDTTPLAVGGAVRGDYSLLRKPVRDAVLIDRLRVLLAERTKIRG